MPASCSRIRLGWLAGVRWLRFRDDFEYATSQTDDMFGATADDFYYTTVRSTTWSDSSSVEISPTPLLSASACTPEPSSASWGITHAIRYATWNKNRRAMTNSPNPAYDNVPYDFMTSRNDFAFLGEGDCWTQRSHQVRLGCVRWIPSDWCQRRCHGDRSDPLQV